MNDRTKNKITILGISGIPEVKPGSDIGEIISNYLEEDLSPLNGDIIVVAQKIISKS